jgi:hypothetical protein
MVLPTYPTAFSDDAKPAQQLAEHEEPPSESSLLPGNKPKDSLNANCGAIRTTSPDSSIGDSSTVRLGRGSQYSSVHGARRHASRSPAPPPRTVHAKLQIFWVKNKGLALVLIAQFFGALMNVTTRMLEMEGNDGEQYCKFSSSSLLTYCRERLPSISSLVRKNEHYCHVLIAVYVVQENRAFSVGYERSEASVNCERSDGILWNLWHVL